TALIKEIEIYRNDESEYPLKRIGLNFPVFKDGGEVTELLWDKGNTVERYRALLRNVEMAQVFAKSEVKVWECRNCGHIVVGEKAPEVCLTCNHPQSYFEIHAENY
uniref:rubredoxin-like domain-containing protein n=1 Tax=Dysosmobacter sp. TaxID=2591382 RepID=UPI003AB6B9AA